MEITFSVNRYDKYGDIIETGFYVHFNSELCVKIGDSIGDVDRFMNDIIDVRNEIYERYNYKRN